MTTMLPREIVAAIARHDSAGAMRGVCREWKNEWDRQHQRSVFAYSMLAEPRSLATAQAVLSYMAGLAVEPARDLFLWSIPVRRCNFEYVTNVLKYVCGRETRLDSSDDGGDAIVYLTPCGGGASIDVYQSYKNGTTFYVEPFGRGTHNTVVRIELALVLKDVDAMLQCEHIGWVEHARRRKGGLERLRRLGFATTSVEGFDYPREITMPPTMEHDKAVDTIDNKGGLNKICSLFPGAVVFEETDTLEHVPVEGRLLVCVFDKDGNNKTPVDPSKKFHATDIVGAFAVDRMFMGPRTVCKELSSTTSKQTAYLQVMQGSKRSQRLISELFKVYSHEHYAEAVDKHPMHKIKQTALCKNNDGKKAIMALSRKGKLFAPVAEDDDGKQRDFVARRKVFGTRHEWKETGTDYDRHDITEFCKENASKSRTGHMCIDLVPTFFLDGEKCKEYDAIRSSSAAVAVLSLRPCWTNAELGNVSFPNSLDYLQLFTVGMARSADAAIAAPNFMDTVPEQPEGSVDFTEANNDDDDDTGDEVDDFVAKRRKIAQGN